MLITSENLDDFMWLEMEMQHVVLLDLLPKLKKMREEGKLGPIRAREA